MKIGIIFCAFNAEDMLEGSLSPWVEAREKKTGGHEFCIAAVSVPFERFEEPRMDDTLEGLRGYLDAGKIDHLIASDQPMKETEARGAALKWLIEAGCDYSWQVDSDEFITVKEIEQTISFIKDRPFVAAAKGCLKNYVFTDKTWLKEPFTPFRIHKCRYKEWRAIRFWDDNNVMYAHPNGNEVPDVDLPWIQIPKSVQFVKHHSWISNERSRKKVEYQTSRSWICSFDWDDSRGGLIWRSGHEQEVCNE